MHPSGSHIRWTSRLGDDATERLKQTSIKLALPPRGVLGDNKFGLGVQSAFNPWADICSIRQSSPHTCSRTSSLEMDTPQRRC